MKKSVFVLLSIVLALVSCSTGSYKNTPVAHGNPGDIVVIMSNDSWNSEPGDSIRAIFYDDCPGVPMEEHLFDLHQIPYDKFIQVNMLHRNIIYQEINKNLSEASITVYKDKYAMKQVFINIAAPNQSEFVKCVSKNSQKLIKTFADADRDRWLNQLEKHTNKTISGKIGKKFDIAVKIPLNFKLDVNRDSFLWISNETKNYTMNILIYSWPLTDTSSLDREHIIAMRNKIVKENIPGEKTGSYMTTETVYDYPWYEITTHRGLETAILRGLWKVKGDFMGGPFVSYTKIDKPRHRMVTVEGFVYLPNEEVRDKIHELEWVCYTFDFIK